MKMNRTFSIILFVAFALILDFGWLTYRQEYHNTLFKTIQKSDLVARYLPAAIVYLMIVVAAYYVVQTSSSLKDSMLRGGSVGFFLYGFYDATNYATFTNWTLQMALTDTLWGTFLFTIVSGIGYYLLK
jgi:uncharacterized membrane protein